MYVLHTRNAHLPYVDIRMLRCTPSIQQMACQAACHQKKILTFMTVCQKCRQQVREKFLLVSDKNIIGGG